MYLIFDTETTGFPLPDFKDPNNPRVTQLAWVLLNEDGKIFKKYSSLIDPDGWTIPTVEELKAKGSKNPHFFEENNMSTERCKKEGRPIEFAVKHFIEAIEESKYIIAHNLKFDLAVMSSEMYRLKKSAKNKPIRICTMDSTTNLLKIPGPKGFKWPNLTELHTFLFGKGFEGAHDAMDDVKACANCFWVLKKRNLITIPPYEEKDKQSPPQSP